MRTTSLACFLALVVSGCGLEGPVPQETKETPKSAASPAAAAPNAAANDAGRATAHTPRGAPSPADGAAAAQDSTAKSLREARRGFTTKLVKQEADHKPAPTPPAGIMQVVQYESPIGRLKAYLTPAPADGKKHPAIIWITGGDCNGIDDGCWKDGPADNEQSAAAFRKSPIVVMFPSLRGGNDNPGYKEGMFGEVDDIMAAAAYLAKQDYVDPKRIYLGGHSTGGTMVLLVAECSDQFRAVFSFGAAASIANYGGRFAYHDLNNQQETFLRSPILWFPSISVPTFAIEGTDQGTIAAQKLMAQRCNNPLVRFLPVDGATHFSVLAPAEKLIVEQILRDTGDTCKIELTEEALNKAYKGAANLPPRAALEVAAAPQVLVDQTENTAAGIPWAKDIVLGRPATIGFHLTSQGRFAVTVVTDKAYQALQRSDEKALAKRDFLFMRESQGLEMDGRLAVPAGTSWFFIENRSDAPVDFHLKCYAVGE